MGYGLAEIPWLRQDPAGSRQASFPMLSGGNSLPVPLEIPDMCVNKVSVKNTVTLQVESQESKQNQDGEDNLGANQINAPEPRTVADPESIAPGYGGPLKDVPPERFNSTAVPRSYHSPWNHALVSDPALHATLLPHMPEPEPRPEAPSYKSFNRVATPFAGYKSSRPAIFKAPEMDPSPVVALPDYPELQGDAAANRPTFNRTALGWVTVGTPLLLSTGALDPSFIPESDDL